MNLKNDEIISHKLRPNDVSMLFDYSTPLRVTASWALGHPS
jgi:hypothetical protein